MSKRIAFLSAAALGSALLAAPVLPAAAADYYGGGYDGGYDGGRPLDYHSRDDVFIEGGRAHVEHRQDLRPAEGYRRGPGPVVFDERGPEHVPDHRFDGYGGPVYRRPVAVERFGYDRPPAFVPHAERPYGGDFGYGYRPAAVAVGPAIGEGYGAPDEGCTVERARSITPAGWEKTVTHRTCYRR